MDNEMLIKELTEKLNAGKGNKNLVKIREKYLFGKILILREIVYLDDKA